MVKPTFTFANGKKVRCNRVGPTTPSASESEL